MKNLIFAFCALLIAVTPVYSDDAAPTVCPRCGHSLVSVPVLIGLPTVEMAARMKRGEVILGGCCGDPAHPEHAFICMACRQYRTETMQLWQPLPPFFASDQKPQDAPTK